MTIWKCPTCDYCKESRCKQKKCPNCGEVEFIKMDEEKKKTCCGKWWCCGGNK